MKKRMKKYVEILTSLKCLYFSAFKINLKLKNSQSYLKGRSAMYCGWETKMHKDNKTHSSTCLLVQSRHLKLLLSLICFIIYEAICSQSVHLRLVTAQSPFLLLLFLLFLIWNLPLQKA